MEDKDALWAELLPLESTKSGEETQGCQNPVPQGASKLALVVSACTLGAWVLRPSPRELESRPPCAKSYRLGIVAD